MARSAQNKRVVDPEIAACLRDVMDPEVGISVLDLGLVYGANRNAHGIDVAITLTTRACPLGEMIVDEARERLTEQFPETSIDVALVWDPPWSPNLITDRGHELLARD
jgi:metal-sulfur cluster biosynthetic enzyme